MRTPFQLVRRLPLSLLALAILATGCAPALLHVAMGTERGRANLHESSVVVEGIRLTMTSRRGDADGPTAVLIHGFGGDKDNWTRMAAELPTSWSLMIPDLAGFGESDKPEDAHYDIVAQVERVHRFIQLAPSRPVILVGNSMGGHIAAATAVLHPEDVSFLVLIDAAGIQSPEPSLIRQAFLRGENPLLTENVADFDRLMALMFVTPPTMPDVVKTYFAERAVAAKPFNDHIFRQMGERPFPLEGRLKDIRATTLIIWGDHDAVLHQSAAPIFARGIGRSSFALMQQTGHTPMIERPRDTAALITDFVGVGTR